MSPTHVVHLLWTPAEQGGRTTLPDGPVYATIAHFDGEPLSGSFSVVIEFPPTLRPQRHDGQSAAAGAGQLAGRRPSAGTGCPALGDRRRAAGGDGRSREFAGRGNGILAGLHPMGLNRVCPGVPK